LETSFAPSQLLLVKWLFYAPFVVPPLVVILHAELGRAVEVCDIVQPATLESFAHAG